SSSRRSSSLGLGLFPAARDSPAVRAPGFGLFAAGHAVGWPASWGKPWLRQGSGGQFVAARRRSWLRGRPKQEACVPLPVVACCVLPVPSSRTRPAGPFTFGASRQGIRLHVVSGPIARAVAGGIAVLIAPFARRDSRAVSSAPLPKLRL